MKVSYNEYLLSRSFNRKLFGKVKDAISQLNFNASATITMSAKTQQPEIIVTGPENGLAADEIYQILNEYFQTAEPFYEDDNTTTLEFRDNY